MKALLSSLACAALAAASPAQTCFNLVDVDPTDFVVSSDIAFLHEFQGEWYFVATTADHGRELWKTDGTHAGTQLVVDLEPGPGSSEPRVLVEFQGALHFAATTTQTGWQLFRLDPLTGTAASITGPSGATGPGASTTSLWLNDIYRAFVVNGRLVFGPAGYADRKRMWSTDGTVGGAVELPKSGQGGDMDLGIGTATSQDGSVGYYSARWLEGPVGFQHWSWYSTFRTDGTPAGTQFAGSTSSESPPTLKSSTYVGVPLQFKAVTSGGITNTFWYELTPAGGMLSALKASTSRILKGPDGAVYSVDGGEFGVSTWILRYQNGVMSLFTDLNPGGSSIAPVLLDFLGPDLICFADLGNGQGHEPVRVDPAGNAFALGDLRPGPLGSMVDKGSVLATTLAGRTWFTANDGVHGNELWVTDGTPAGTTLVADINTGGEADVRSLEELDATHILFVATGTDVGKEVWVSDGTPAGTHVVRDLTPNPGADSGIQTVHSPNGMELLFTTRAGSEDDHLWRWSLLEGATDLGDLEARVEEGSFFTEFVGGQQRTFFIAEKAGFGEELWVTDGEPGGAQMLIDAKPGSQSSYPRAWTVQGGRLYFLTKQGNNWRELHSTDGTPGGTQKEPSLVPQLPLAQYGPLVEYRGELVFAMADNGAWNFFRTDLTPEGTSSLMGPVGTYFQYSNNIEYVVFGDRIVFASGDPVNGVELWATDGTLPGTLLLNDIFPGVSSSTPRDLTVIGDRLYFTAAVETSTSYRVLCSMPSTLDSVTKHYVNTGGVPTPEIDALHPVGGELYLEQRYSNVDTLFHLDPAALVPIEIGSGVKSVDIGFEEMVGSEEGAYFYADFDGTGVRLHFTDGTSAGTHAVCMMGGSDDIVDVGNTLFANGFVAFTGRTEEYGNELFAVLDPIAYSLRLAASASGITLDVTPPRIGQLTSVAIEGIPDTTPIGFLAMSAPVDQATTLLALPNNPCWLDPVTVVIIQPIVGGPTFAASYPVPNDPALLLWTLNVQAYFLPNATLPALTTNGVSVAIGL